MKEHSGIHEAKRAASACVSDWSRSPIPLSEEVEQSSKTSKNTAIIHLSQLVKQHHWNRKCKPQLQVAFAKTHKTGSSTLQNIIFR